MAMLTRNGFQAGATKAAAGIVPLTLDGTGVSFPGGVKGGDVHTILGYVALQWHLRIHPLHPGWCWGWNYRPVRGSAATLSEHSAGCAIDLDAPLHPLSKRGTLSAAQVLELRAILREVDNTVRWGGDFSRPDEMHLEMAPGYSNERRANVAARIRGMGGSFPTATSPAANVKAAPVAEVSVVGGAGGADGLLRPGSKGAEVLGWQRELWRLGYGVGEHDGQYGPATEGATLDLQRAAGGIDVDGIVGNATRDAARRVPTYPKGEGPGLPLCGPGQPGATIVAFQGRLAQRGWRIGVDGAYGPQTERVLRQFQQQVGLTVDGIGGPMVWTALHLRPVT